MFKTLWTLMTSTKTWITTLSALVIVKTIIIWSFAQRFWTIFSWITAYDTLASCWKSPHSLHFPWPSRIATLCPSKLNLSLILRRLLDVARSRTGKHFWNGVVFNFTCPITVINRLILLTVHWCLIVFLTPKLSFGRLHDTRAIVEQSVALVYYRLCSC